MIIWTMIKNDETINDILSNWYDNLSPRVFFISYNIYMFCCDLTKIIIILSKHDISIGIRSKFCPLFLKKRYWILVFIIAPTIRDPLLEH
jgi:hypothetical protein